jgi:hypothetical protein
MTHCGISALGTRRAPGSDEAVSACRPSDFLRMENPGDFAQPFLIRNVVYVAAITKN